MAYPEKGANYDHKPRFVERMKRAEGGPINADGGAGVDLQSPVNEGSGYETEYDGETNSAGPSRLTEVLGKPPFQGRRIDTELNTDTDFGEGHDVKTVADRMTPLKPQYLGGGHREDRRRNGGRVRKGD